MKHTALLFIYLYLINRATILCKKGDPCLPIPHLIVIINSGLLCHRSNEVRGLQASDWMTQTDEELHSFKCAPLQRYDCCHEHSGLSLTSDTQRFSILISTMTVIFLRTVSEIDHKCDILMLLEQ